MTGGTGLAFVAFAEAMLFFPVPNLWSVIFFLMLASIGLSTIMGTITGVIASVRDVGCQIEKWLLALYVCGGAYACSLLAKDFRDVIRGLMRCFTRFFTSFL